MPLDSASQLGKLIGDSVKKQSRTDENLTPDESEGQLLLKNQEVIEIAGSVILTQKRLPTDALILDHPVYGELDNPSYLLDGSYDPVNSFPLSFPISFATASTIIHEVTF